MNLAIFILTKLTSPKTLMRRAKSFLIKFILKFSLALFQGRKVVYRKLFHEGLIV